MFLPRDIIAEHAVKSIDSGPEHDGIDQSIDFLSWSAEKYVPDLCYSAACFMPASHHSPSHGGRTGEPSIMVYKQAR